MESVNKTQQTSFQHLEQILSNAVEMTPEHQNALLTEYEVGQNHAWKWDNAIWQSAAIFLSASLAGFIVVTQIPDSSHYKLFLVIITAFSAILVLMGWFAMIQRWEAYKLVVFFRLREIEQELGLWKNRYLEHLRITKILHGQGLSVVSEDDRARLKRLDQEFSEYPGISVMSLMKMIVIGLIIGWASLLVFEIISTVVLL